MTMPFEKKNFMGIELDVLVGHPEHKLLFIATQVARSAGLENPKSSARKAMLAAKTVGYIQIKELESKVHQKDTLNPQIGTNRWRDIWLSTESATYQMLLRGHAPASEPFRKWVTEEVLPSIYETGKYNAEESTNPIAQGIMDRLMSLEGVVLKQNAMLEQMQEALGKFAHAEIALAPAPEVSPYVGQTMIALCDPAGFNARTYRELAEYLPRPAVDKLEPL